MRPIGMRKFSLYVCVLTVSVASVAFIAPASAQFKLGFETGEQLREPIAPEIIFLILKGDVSDDEEPARRTDLDDDGVDNSADQCPATPGRDD